ncbi:oligosaccharide flippase family protein [Marinomonas profundimaris]|uniref:Polysaccharide biosynthesis protein n=1 Tax=Marinomonas profundimaris TaxID=1208321 RepID=W1RX87_9GAMM|nr:oligosaccharide flippase family protein [Marinomonas profundimaris]ETI61425.1 hypothetical protein D104_05735 [Marinomonas profundimaris]
MKIQFFFNFFDRILKLGVPFFLSVLAAKSMDKDVFGVYAYISMLITSSIVLIGGGVDTVFGKKIAENGKVILHDFICYLFIRLFLSMILASIILYHLINKFSIGNELFFIVLVLVLMLVFNFSEVVFASLMENKKLFVITFMSALLFFPMKIYIFSVIGEYKYKFLIDVFEYVFILIISCFFVFKYVDFSFDYGGMIKSIKDLATKSFPLWLNCLLLMIYSRVDFIFVGNVADSEGIADYSIALNLNSVALILPTVLLTVFFPKMVRWYNTNKIDYDQRMVVLIRVFIFYGVLWCFFCNFLGSYVVGFIYGEEYKTSSYYLNVLSLCIPFVMLGQLLGQHMIITLRYWVSIRRSVCGICFTFLSYFLFYDGISIKVIAFISVANVFFVNFLLYLLMKDTKDIRCLMYRVFFKGYSNE